jgi:hypothetical protein
LLAAGLRHLSASHRIRILGIPRRRQRS